MVIPNYLKETLHKELERTDKDYETEWDRGVNCILTIIEDIFDEEEAERILNGIKKELY